jgi:glycosyltransferase involved in cell wall biosynthesis
MTFPGLTAHTIHSCIAAGNLAEQGAVVRIFPSGIKGGEHSPLPAIYKSLGFSALPPLHIHGSLFRHKGLYSLFFQLALWSFTSRRQRQAPTLCYASSVKETVLALKLRKLRGLSSKELPVVFEAHHLISKLKSGSKSRELFKLEQQAFTEADLVIFISDELKKKAADYLPVPHSSLVSHLGYNDKIITPLTFTSDHNRIRLTYVGSLQYGKGIEELIRAMSQLPDKYRLQIIGGQPKHGFEAASALVSDLGLQSRVHFTGQVMQDNLPDLLRDCDLFVIPITTDEDFFCPMKMYEGIGFGLPIVATPQNSLREIMTDGKNAVFAKDFSANALAAAIREAGENNALRDRMREENIILGRELKSSTRAKTILDHLHGQFFSQKNN